MGIIIPFPGSTQVETPAFDFADAMARADRCPECLDNLEVPHHITTDWPEASRPNFYAEYHCARCGHEWTTGWGA